ncbi:MULTISPECIES: STAS-like domain-containing protein [Alteromonas]|uniref:STAS-like domain-containing protein n=1 Tax=Alteromonas stellipolaris TaxID=233316 RepID=A0AAW7Z0U4_9ALTE|nr:MULTISPECIES: STAS-like domain-containing protein [Alteromonas]AMJ87030.1 hypothetical protein AV939_10890 [Alteromonas sp. Mac1]AMJ90891.1 hypothetical protein AV940_10660 [Alteromonas sp. Mac2]MDO6576196.1 STAS-like domain-containing protein [Alteromonas stellipolaris]
MIEISVAKDFSIKPFGRYLSDGKWSGERFRKDILYPAFKLNPGENIIVSLNNIPRGFGSSFLEEAFGGLVRDGIPKETLEKNLVILSDEEDYIIEIKEYIEKA